MLRSGREILLELIVLLLPLIKLGLNLFELSAARFELTFGAPPLVGLLFLAAVQFALPPFQLPAALIQLLLKMSEAFLLRAQMPLAFLQLLEATGQVLLDARLLRNQLVFTHFQRFGSRRDFLSRYLRGVCSLTGHSAVARIVQAEHPRAIDRRLKRR
jgi:hypothetical protein